MLRHNDGKKKSGKEQFFLGKYNYKKYQTVYKETPNFKDRYQTHSGCSLSGDRDEGPVIKD